MLEQQLQKICKNWDLVTCKKKECRFCNFGAYTYAEGKAGLTDARIKDHFEHMKGIERITSKFTVVLKATE
ncbi:MAG: hypothetical protein ACI4PK_04150 [Oscillospiraceae bacterium]